MPKLTSLTFSHHYGEGALSSFRVSFGLRSLGGGATAAALAALVDRSVIVRTRARVFSPFLLLFACLFPTVCLWPLFSKGARRRFVGFPEYPLGLDKYCLAKRRPNVFDSR